MSDKIKKLNERLEAALAEKNYYEAHQICRTIYHRLLKAEEYEKLLHILYSNAIILCDAKEFISAADLTQLFVAVLRRTNIMSDELSTQLSNLYGNIPRNCFGPVADQVLELLNPPKKEAITNDEQLTKTIVTKTEKKEVEMDLD